MSKKIKIMVFGLLGWLVFTVSPAWGKHEGLDKLLAQCPKWVRLSIENTYFIRDLTYQKKSFLLQLESACTPGYLESRQIAILEDWVARGNVLWIQFSPPRVNIPDNDGWATHFGLRAQVSSASEIISQKEGGIIPIPGLTDGVERLQIGTPAIYPSYYFFEGEGLIPLLKNKDGQTVFGLKTYGRGRIIFDGIGWLFFETEKEGIDPFMYDSNVFWLNFFDWSGACVKPPIKKSKMDELLAPPPEPTRPAPPPPPPPAKALSECEKLAKELRVRFAHLELKVVERSDQVCLVILDKVLFDSGSDQLKQSGRKILREVVEVLKEKPSYPIHIEGHTDSNPIHGQLKKKFSDNLTLSQARARTVYDYFIRFGGIAPDRMGQEGYGDTRPAASNDTQEGRQQNRRTEIIFQLNTQEGK
jgi:flagellar motor protein MotB